MKTLFNKLFFYKKNNYEFFKLRNNLKPIINYVNYNEKNSNDLVIKYSKIIYESLLVDKMCDLQSNRRNNIICNFDEQVEQIRMKYNVFNLFHSKKKQKLKKSNNHVFLNLIVEILKFFYGYNKEIKINIESPELTKDEKWAINFLRGKRNSAKIMSEIPNKHLIDKHSLEISKYFNLASTKRDEDEGFDDEFKEIGVKYLETIKNKNDIFVSKKRKVFHENYFRNKTKKLFNTIFGYKFIKNISNYFKKNNNYIVNKLNGFRKRRADWILRKMEERLETINYNNFKANFGIRNLTEDSYIRLYNAVKLNKRIITNNL